MRFIKEEHTACPVTQGVNVNAQRKFFVSIDRLSHKYSLIFIHSVRMGMVIFLMPPVSGYVFKVLVCSRILVGQGWKGLAFEPTGLYSLNQFLLVGYVNNFKRRFYNVISLKNSKEACMKG
jgi:hypothetical protein